MSFKEKIQVKYKGEQLTIAEKGHKLAEQWLENIPPSTNFKDKNKLTKDCYNFLLDNYEPSGIIWESWLFWWIVRSILWWIAQNFVDNLYKE